VFELHLFLTDLGFAEGTIGFPSEKLSVINKSEAIDWRHLPPPNDNQIIAIRVRFVDQLYRFLLAK
jgi:hypothetical protein